MLFAQLFGIITPVVGLQAAFDAVFLHHFLIESGLFFGFGKRRLPYLHQQIVNVFVVFGHAIVKHIVGVVVETENLRFLQAKFHDLVDNLFVRIFAIQATGGVSRPEFLAEFAVLAVLEERLHRRDVHRESVFALGVFHTVGSLFCSG